MEANMNLYDLNKGIIKSKPTLDNKEITQLILDIYNWRNENHHGAEYFMLLGREIGYYTLFRWKARTDDTLGDVTVECLQDLGKIKDWAVNPNGVELWIERPEEEVTCLFLFPYDNGIVYYGG